MSCESAVLYVVATPLGNDGDLSPRARQVLEAVDTVLAEDTRRAKTLCARCGLHIQRFVSFHDHNEADGVQAVMARLRAGERMALVSDAGLPLVADTGYRLVRACREGGIGVTVVPGPCAPVTALAGSGLPPQPFTFFGFLPRSRSDIEAVLRPFADLPTTLVFFERRDRLSETLRIAAAVLGPREVCIARELTKTYEEYRIGRLEAPPPMEGILGEITVVVGPPEAIGASSREDVLALIAEERPLGGAPRDVARRVQVRVRGWTVKAIYAMMSAKTEIVPDPQKRGTAKRRQA